MRKRKFHKGVFITHHPLIIGQWPPHLANVAAVRTEQVLWLSQLSCLPSLYREINELEPRSGCMTLCSYVSHLRISVNMVTKMLHHAIVLSSLR
jgi:hypothetical protein